MTESLVPAHVEPVAFEATDAMAVLAVLAVVAVVLYLYRRNR